jgi:hypothetical protein
MQKIQANGDSLAQRSEKLTPGSNKKAEAFAEHWLLKEKHYPEAFLSRPVEGRPGLSLLAGSSGLIHQTDSKPVRPQSSIS